MSSTLDLLQNDRSTLTSEQWNLISNMIHVYDEQHSIVQFKYIVNQMYTLPPKLRSKPSNTVYIISQAFGSLQPLIERSRDLYSLSTDTCRALIQHNMYTKGGFNTLFIFRELDLYRNFGIMNAYTALYGYDVAITSARNSDECDPNGNLIKIFDDEEDIKTMSISMYRIEIQNMYVTAFWKYLVYLYGFDEAVIRFSSLVKLILNLLYLGELMLNNVIHTQMLDEAITETEHLLIIRDYKIFH